MGTRWTRCLGLHGGTMHQVPGAEEWKPILRDLGSGATSEQQVDDNRDTLQLALFKGLVFRVSGTWIQDEAVAIVQGPWTRDKASEVFVPRRWTATAQGHCDGHFQIAM